jgi:hypothetical protein
MIGDKRDIFKDLQQVIGSPEENRELMVRMVLLDKNMSCKKCSTVYRNAKDMNQLFVAIEGDYNLPGSLKVFLKCCLCNHAGNITLRPNPLIKV